MGGLALLMWSELSNMLEVIVFKYYNRRRG